MSPTRTHIDLAKTSLRTDEIDNFVCAEILNKENDKELYNIVMKNMIHGPCSAYNRKLVCMDDGKCTKKFPKDFIEYTEQGNDSYPKYRRHTPINGKFMGIVRRYIDGVTINQVVQNNIVVPYNLWLLRQWKCHINVEICSSIKAIKYVLKYINKGTDQAVYNLQQTQGEHMDEIKNYLEGRYMNPYMEVILLL